MIQKEDLQLAIKHLNESAIPVDKKSQKLINCFEKVISAADVEVVLSIVLNGDFKTFYESLQQHRNQNP